MNDRKVLKRTDLVQLYVTALESTGAGSIYYTAHGIMMQKVLLTEDEDHGDTVHIISSRCQEVKRAPYILKSASRDIILVKENSPSLHFKCSQVVRHCKKYLVG